MQKKVIDGFLIENINGVICINNITSLDGEPITVGHNGFIQIKIDGTIEICGYDRIQQNIMGAAIQMWNEIHAK